MLVDIDTIIRVCIKNFISLIFISRGKMTITQDVHVSLLETLFFNFFLLEKSIEEEI